MSALLVSLVLVCTLPMTVLAGPTTQVVDANMAVAESVSGDAVQFHTLSDAVYNGQQVVFANQHQAEKFLRYYYVNYRIGEDMQLDLNALMNTQTGEITLSIDDFIDRESLMNNIINKYGAIRYEGDDLTTINETWRRIHAGTSYDLAYAKAAPSMCLQAGRGVCWFFASCMSVILNFEGIPTITVSGKLKGVDHAWNLIYTGNGYYVFDATRDDDPWVTDADLPYYVEKVCY